MIHTGRDQQKYCGDAGTNLERAAGRDLRTVVHPCSTAPRPRRGLFRGHSPDETFFALGVGAVGVGGRGELRREAREEGVERPERLRVWG